MSNLKRKLTSPSPPPDSKRQKFIDVSVERGDAQQSELHIRSGVETVVSNMETSDLLAFILDGNLSFDQVKHLVSNQRDVILKLDTSMADSFMSILQDNVDKMPVDDEHRGTFLDTLLQLAIDTSIIPKCLDITGITNRADEPITTGGFGDVYKALWNDRTVALKKLRETAGIDKEKLHRNLCREVLLWRQLRHSNILEFWGICKDVFSSPAIVSPWMVKGNVMQFAQAYDARTRKQLVYRLLSQVAQALDYLHSQAPVIVHQDVRCANILVNDANEAVLSDFGLSRLDSTFFNTFTSSLEHGCLRWQAPELLFPDTQITPGSGQSGEDSAASLPKPTPASDVYALGMTALELITKDKPFSSVVCDAVVVVEIYHDRKPVRTSQVNHEIWTFLLTCWSKIPSDRPRAIDASDFFLNAVEEERRRMTGVFWLDQAGVNACDSFPISGIPGSTGIPNLFPRRSLGLSMWPSLPLRSATLAVPEEFFVAFSGKKCCNFCQLEEAYGVTITYCFSRDGRSSKEAVISSAGAFWGQSLQAAKAEIEKLIELHKRFGHLL